MLRYIIILFLLANTATAEIIPINDFSEIQEDFAEKYNKDYYPQNILVIIAIEGVVFKSLIPNFDNLDKNSAAKLTAIFQQMKPISRITYTSDVMLTNYDQELTASNLPNIIMEISKNGTPVIAATKGLTGNFNDIKSLEIWRADYLKKFNIDFSSSFAKNNWIIFNNLETFENTYPVFYKGILNSNNTSISSLILNFLIQTKFLPQIVIMISDKEDDLTSTELQLKTYSQSTGFTGYHYTYPNQVILQNVENNVLKQYQDIVNKVNKVKRNNPVKKTNIKQSKNPYDKTK